MDVTDNLAGIDEVASQVQIFSPDGEPRDFDSLSLTSGGLTNGTFGATVTLPRLAQQGTWTVELTLVDRAGNDIVWTSTQLVGDGYPGERRADRAVGDDTSPLLGSFSFTPSQIDTSQSNQTMTFDLGTTDDLSGVDPAASRVTVISPDGQPRSSTSFQLQSGSSTTAPTRPPSAFRWGSAPGTWSVSVLLVDGAGNARSLSTQDLDDAGFPATFTNVGIDPS